MKSILKRYSPTTPSNRFRVSVLCETKQSMSPEKSLCAPKNKSGGRNRDGRITVRHIGGGAKQKYRIINFRKNRFDQIANVIDIQYDPNRNVPLCLIEYSDKKREYMIRPHGVSVGDQVVSSDICDVKAGNTMRIKNIPVGTFVHNVELKPLGGAKIARSAGNYVQIYGRQGFNIIVKMPSHEVRLINENCFATVGQVANADYRNVVIGSAGRARHLGIRPTVRGVAMNPVDHPLGGGEGKTSGGRHPVSPWGKNCKGLKTRKNKYSNRFIVSSRSRFKKK